jgi:hypothetical protein
MAHDPRMQIFKICGFQVALGLGRLFPPNGHSCSPAGYFATVLFMLE